MEKIVIKNLDIKRFNALAAQSRSPAAAYMSEELEGYADSDEIVLGIVLRDTIDSDFVGIILGRDEGDRFRAFDVKASIPTQEEARVWVHGGIKWYAGKGERTFLQGDESKDLDLFTPVVPVAKQHPYFAKLAQEDSFIPAKAIINQLMPHYTDIDGNFVEQFQSSGFDARLWELYLNTYLNEEQLFLDREYHAPDFLVQKYGIKVAIEAVIVGRKESNPISFFQDEPKFLTPSEIKEKLKDEMPIKFGSPLFSKLRKEYWKLDHVKGNALIFAIADFHDDQSMQWSSNALISYLYGVKHEFTRDKDGKLIISPLKIEKHQVGNKTIPSGYFFQDEAENISAVLFSSSGTISKFNRIGRQAGYGPENIIMHRFGTCHDHDPNAFLPKQFAYTVTTNSNETWGEGLSMFHNPNAKHPVPEALFPSIAHHYYDNGQIVSHLPEFHPYSSMTINMKIEA
ncbi:glycosaminoglycan attachment protein [Klebsiella pneumoniae]|uniref:glycosaminoglycan attachment protein n=1 Tax=Klebsiella pneumoniae TaxID=573 RepID=UPI0025A0ED13|nr:glycosaminoglycan attachment protein [Klebsiella pneumoniae]MDM7109698.1 glycosaminoglycan attachment protein [Klebsiella pneumoniae]